MLSQLIEVLKLVSFQSPNGDCKFVVIFSRKENLSELLLSGDTDQV